MTPLFLDWWLLARSAGTVSFGSSSFLHTALRYREASTDEGFHIKAWPTGSSNISELLRDDFMDRVCEVKQTEARNVSKRRTCEGHAKDFWGLGCAKDEYW